MPETRFPANPSRAFAPVSALGPSHRRLQEPVMSSAQDELGLDTPEHDSGSTYTAGEGAAPLYASASRPAWWMRMEGSMSRYVNEQPGRAALMALGAGALAALLLGRGMRGRRRKD